MIALGFVRFVQDVRESQLQSVQSLHTRQPIIQAARLYTLAQHLKPSAYSYGVRFGKNSAGNGELVELTMKR